MSAANVILRALVSAEVCRHDLHMELKAGAVNRQLHEPTM